MAVLGLNGAEFRAACGITKIIGTLGTALALQYFMSRIGLWTPFRGPFGHLVGVLMVIVAVEETGTVVAWILYRPKRPPQDDAELLSLTVVVPAYNESSFVQQTLKSIMQSDYPRSKLQLVVVDDGSTDDTWKHINTGVAVLESFGISCSTHRHPQNRGKRAAICTGFRLARGDVIVSLDSDSILDQRALRNIAAPMASDTRVGGVAGHLTALNVRGKIVPRLLDILFDCSGNIPRAAQSYTGGFVTILPGALSAFRASAVLPLLGGLCESTFLGAPLRHGEDVELTMGLLQRGWMTIYQSNAVVYTTVPETTTKTMLMYTRWERSSYVYLCMGFLGMAINEVFGRSKSLSKEYMALDHKRAISKGELGHKTSEEGSCFPFPSICRLCGRLYILLNLVTTAVSNPLLVIYCIIQVYNAIYQPTMILVSAAATILYSFWHCLLFVADALAEEEGVGNMQQTYKSFDDSGRDKSPLEISAEGHIFIESRKMRLCWRLRYSGLAGLFQMIFVSWSSILALPTLKSQSWLTR